MRISGFVIMLNNLRLHLSNPLSRPLQSKVRASRRRRPGFAGDPRSR